MQILLGLFAAFAKIGCFTFGGGYAMISIIENICVEKKKWITHEDMLNITVIAESTPGPIAINCATFVGYKKKGWLGALAATLGIVLPSFVIIFLIASVLDSFLEIAVIANAFKGIKLAVGILILDAGVKMLKKLPKKPVELGIMAVSTLVMLFIDLFALKFSSISLMLLAAALGLIFYLLGNCRKKEEKQ